MSINKQKFQFHKWINILIPFFFIGVAIWATWPLTARLASHMPGGCRGCVDIFVHYWNGWWMSKAWTNGLSPYFTSYLMHPNGLVLTYHNFALLSIIPWLALRPFIGEFAAFNLVLIAYLAFSGFAAYLLVYHLVNNRWAALLAGMIYLLWPYRLIQLGHPNLISTQWIPLFLLALIITLQRGHWQYGLLTGICFALVGYTRWQQLIPATIMGGVYFLVTLPVHWQTYRRWLTATILAAVVAILLLTPPAIVLIRTQQTTPTILVKDEESEKRADILAYLIPPSDSYPSLGPLAQNLYGNHQVDSKALGPYIAISTLFLALWGAWWGRHKGSRPWAILALLLSFLALGPILQFNGQLYPDVPMPYRLLVRLMPFIRLLRFSGRFNIFLALPISVLAGHGVAHLLSRVQGRSTPIILSAFLIGVSLFQYQTLPIETRPYDLSPFYDELATEAPDQAVLDLPLGEQDSKIYMYAQTIHQHPIVQGKTARFPINAHAYYETHPWLQILQQQDRPPRLPDIGRQLKAFAADNIGYLILHKERLGKEKVAQWGRYLLTKPYFEDDRIVVYDTTPLAGEDFELLTEWVPNLGPINIVVSTACLNPNRILEVDIGWGSTDVITQDFDIELALVNENGQVIQHQSYSLSPDWPSSQWGANTIAWGYYPIRLIPEAPGGSYQLTMTMLDVTTKQPQSQALPIQRVQVESATCGLALFGDEMRLLAYNFTFENTEAVLTLQWQSQRQMATDYKIFVHIFDPVTGIPVAQNDNRPLQGTYSTTLWDAGERIKEHIPVSLAGVPAGNYGLAVGVYDAMTGQRLPVFDGEGQLEPDGRFILPETLSIE